MQSMRSGQFNVSSRQGTITMKVLRAPYLGMCSGVRNAVNLALELGASRQLTVLGDLVHNPDVIATLRARGIHSVQEVSEIRTRDVLITAHGLSSFRRHTLMARGYRVWDATCPLVQAAKEAAMEMERSGWHPLVIGSRDHVEVRGITEDLRDFHVVLTERDIEQLPPRPRWGVIAQTTQPIERVQQLLTALHNRFPYSEVQFKDTVCPATKFRRTGAIELARTCDAMVVVGGRTSNNTRELAEACRTVCNRVYHVERAMEIRDEWFHACESVGITAGTSTPEWVITEVEQRLRSVSVEPARTANRLHQALLKNEPEVVRC